MSDNNNETPTDKREPNFNLPSISAAIAKAIDQLPQADLYLKRKSKVTAKKLKLDTSNAKRQLSNAMKDSVLFCAVNSRDSAAVVEVDTDVLVAKLESQGDGMKTIRAYVEEELGRNLENSVLQSSFVTLDSFDQFFIGTCCLMCLKFSQDLVSGQLNFGK